MKKIFSVLLAVMMMFAVMVPAFAAEITDKAPASQDVLVRTDTSSVVGGGEWYSVKIPATPKDIAWGDTNPVDVSYDVACQLGENRVLKVSIGSPDVTDGEDVFTLTNASYPAIPYTPAKFAEETYGPVAGTKAIDPDTKVETITYDTTNAATITIAANDWLGRPIAAYTDTLTYTVSIGAAA